jgi:hypothetical protein
MMSNDEWKRNGDEMPDAFPPAAHKAAEGIAQTMAQAFRDRSGEMDQHSWLSIAKDACVRVNGVPEVIRVLQTPDFAQSIADCTAPVVVPAGSEWANQLEQKTEKVQRDYFLGLGIPASYLDQAIEKWRELRRAKQAEFVSLT